MVVPDTYSTLINSHPFPSPSHQSPEGQPQHPPGCPRCPRPAGHHHPPPQGRHLAWGRSDPGLGGGCCRGRTLLGPGSGRRPRAPLRLAALWAAFMPLLRLAPSAFLFRGLCPPRTGASRTRGPTLAAGDTRAALSGGHGRPPQPPLLFFPAITPWTVFRKRFLRLWSLCALKFNEREGNKQLDAIYLHSSLLRGTHMHTKIKMMRRPLGKIFLSPQTLT